MMLAVTIGILALLFTLTVEASEQQHNGTPMRRLRRLSRHEYEREMREFEGYDPTLPYAHSMHTLYAMPTIPSTAQLHQQQANRRRQLRKAELTPLFPGYGTHYSYLYVGTPPQRQSVIVDTGSHFTAFPCSGCVQCGTHTDPYYEIKNSSTAQTPKCLKDQKCLVSQSYTEGSSWHGYKVEDKLWVGGSEVNLLPGGDNYAVKFAFACQTSETGLFRTQLADGIMGMSNSEDTLPNQLFAQKVTDTKMFSLCYRIGGGIMTIGGVDQRIHTKRGVSYVKSTTKENGWYTVKLLQIHLLDASNGQNFTVENDINALNTGKGVIIDSGTTDTYLPSNLLGKFAAAFKKASNNAVNYATGNIVLTEEQLTKLPTIVFTLEGIGGVGGGDTTGPPVEVAMPMANYVDSVGGGKYALRVYLTEKSGSVLGSNFMNGYNIIFDPEANRVGIAKSNCNYEEFAPIVTDAPTAKPVQSPTKSGKGNKPTIPIPEDTPDKCDEKVLIPYTECTARCDRNDTAYSVIGEQEFITQCDLYAQQGIGNNAGVTPGKLIVCYCVCELYV